MNHPRASTCTHRPQHEGSNLPYRGSPCKHTVCGACSSHPNRVSDWRGRGLTTRSLRTGRGPSAIAGGASRVGCGQPTPWPIAYAIPKRRAAVVAAVTAHGRRSIRYMGAPVRKMLLEKRLMRGMSTSSLAATETRSPTRAPRRASGQRRHRTSTDRRRNATRFYGGGSLRASRES